MSDQKSCPIIDKPEVKLSDKERDYEYLYKKSLEDKDKLVEENEAFKRQIVLDAILLKNQVSINLKYMVDMLTSDIETLDNFEFEDDDPKKKEQEMMILSGNTAVKNLDILISDICKFKYHTLRFLEENKANYFEDE